MGECIFPRRGFPVFGERPPESLVLYNYGDECELETGGWEFFDLQNNHTETKNVDNIYLKTWAKSSAWNKSGIRTIDDIDFAGYNTLKVYCHASISDLSGGGGVEFYVDNTLIGAINQTGTFDYTINPLEIDISDITSFGQFGIKAVQGGAKSGTSYYTETNIYKVELL